MIRTYNDQAQGNVEQFSICSDDSIWSEGEPIQDETESPDRSPKQDNDQLQVEMFKEDVEAINNNIYQRNSNIENIKKGISNPLLLSKWLESAARFQPSENNYSCWAEDRRRRPDPKQKSSALITTRHDRDEVEAAVALTALATASNRVALT